jgi:hypothetical protein
MHPFPRNSRWPDRSRFRRTTLALAAAASLTLSLLALAAPSAPAAATTGGRALPPVTRSPNAPG